MSGGAGRPHRGRRDNGLHAGEFVAVADVDPRIGEHLLDVLGIVGIAAYLAPSADLNPIVRTTTFPPRPTDRLWVDRERLDEARGLLEAVQEDHEGGEEATPGPAGLDVPPGKSNKQSDRSRRRGDPGHQPDSRGPTRGSADPPIDRSGDPFDLDAEWERIIAGYSSTAGPERPHRADRPGATPAEPGPEPDQPSSELPDSPLPPGPSVPPGPTEPTGLGPVDSASDHSPSDHASSSDGDAAGGQTDSDGPANGGGDSGGKGGGPERPPFDAPGGPVALIRPRPGAGGSTGFRTRLVGDEHEILLPGELPPDIPLDDEGYDPPPPPPLPRPSAPVVVALAAIIAGIVLFFRPGVLGVAEPVALILGVFGILGGAAALVWRLREGGSDDDMDDGAVV
jgi:hypothetical protein